MCKNTNPIHAKAIDNGLITLDVNGLGSHKIGIGIGWIWIRYQNPYYKRGLCRSPSPRSEMPWSAKRVPRFAIHASRGKGTAERSSGVEWTSAVPYPPIWWKRNRGTSDGLVARAAGSPGSSLGSGHGPGTRLRRARPAGLGIGSTRPRRNRNEAGGGGGGRAPTSSTRRAGASGRGRGGRGRWWRRGGRRRPCRPRSAS